MEPIINPMLIYMITTVDSLGKLAWAVFAIVAFALFIASLLFLTDDYSNDDKKKKMFINIKKCAKILIVISVVAVITPSASTSYKMLAASYVTTDNVNAAGQGAKEIIDYIFEKVDEMGSGNK